MRSTCSHRENQTRVVGVSLKPNFNTVKHSGTTFPRLDTHWMIFKSELILNWFFRLKSSKCTLQTIWQDHKTTHAWFVVKLLVAIRDTSPEGVAVIPDACLFQWFHLIWVIVFFFFFFFFFFFLWIWFYVNCHVCNCKNNNVSDILLRQAELES